MRLVFKYRFKPKSLNKQIIDDIMWHSVRVYNMCSYEIKEGLVKINPKGNINVESSKIYKRYREECWHSKHIHSHTMLEIIIGMVGEYKSYLALKEKYEKGSKDVKGKPRMPRYKAEKNIQVAFTKYAIRIENNTIKLSLSKEMQEKFKVKSLNFLIPKKLKKLIDFSRIKMIKIRNISKKSKEEYEMLIIYEKEEKMSTGTNTVAIDLGLNNMATCTNAENNESLIIAGETVKSKIRYYNNEISRLQQIQMKMKKGKNFKNTKQIKKLYEKKKNYIETYMHKASRMIVDYALENNSKTIVIGDIKDIKQNMDYNKSFVQIPLQNLVQKIEYKAKLEGIQVEKIKESYTSGVSSLDKEEIVKENYDKTRRITRGLFRSNKGILINADVNGSLNILRKYIKKSSPNLEIAMDIGREQRPLKKRVA